MSDNPEESAYYLRLMSMYMDLCTESVKNVFNFHSPDKNGEKFLLLHVNQAKLTELKRKKVLDKQQSELVITQWPNLKSMDISLLITLSINLFTPVQLPPPAKGWGRHPKGKDISIAADLLRLKKIRNIIVGHYPCARLAQWRFEEEWESIKNILLRIEQHIAPENEEHLKSRIDQYLIQELQPSVKDKHDPKLREWYQEVSKVQEQVDKYAKTLEEFNVYFKSKSSRYERYIKLLIKGGQFVLAALIKAKCQQRDLRSILDEKEQFLKDKITDPKHLEIIYPSESDHLLNPLDLSKWDISLLAGVLLYAFEVNEAVKRAVNNINNARKNYAETAVKALDPDSFVDHMSDLKTSIEVASDYLNAEEKTQIEEILEDCKKTSKEDGSLMTYMNELRSQGLQMKTLSDIYSETVQKIRTLLQEMVTYGISFNDTHMLELKMITVGSDEEKKEVAKNILFEVWQAALDYRYDKNDFQEIKKEVIKILNEIRKKKSVQNVDVKQECILLQMSCRNPRDMLDLIEYFDSDLFRKNLADVCKEVGFYCGTIVAIRANVTIESLDSILNTPNLQEKQETGIRVPITVSSPAAMVELRKFFQSEEFINGTNAIAEELSKHTNSKVELRSLTDMKEFNAVLDGDTDDDSSDSSSTTETYQPLKTGSDRQDKKVGVLENNQEIIPPGGLWLMSDSASEDEEEVVSDMAGLRVMSDSEEDFASAEEGEVVSTMAGNSTTYDKVSYVLPNKENSVPGNVIRSDASIKDILETRFQALEQSITETRQVAVQTHSLQQSMCERIDQYLRERQPPSRHLSEESDLDVSKDFKNNLSYISDSDHERPKSDHMNDKDRKMSSLKEEKTEDGVHQIYGASGGDPPSDDPSSDNESDDKRRDKKNKKEKSQDNNNTGKKAKRWIIDADAWTCCLKSEKESQFENQASSLLEEGKLPDQILLNEICSKYTRLLPSFQNICDDICSYIKQKSNKIVQVWPAYQYKNDDRIYGKEITFVVLTTASDDVELKEFAICKRCIFDVASEKENMEINKKESNDRPSSKEIEDLEKCLKENARKLMKCHSKLTRVTASWFKSRGHDTDEFSVRKELCIALYVHVKGFILSNEEPFPKQVGNYPVDVREGIFTLCRGPHDYHENVKMGCSIRGEVNQGTLGAFIEFENDSRVFGITSAHVVFAGAKLKEILENGQIEYPYANAVTVYQPCSEIFGDAVAALYREGGNGIPGMEIALVDIKQKRWPNDGTFPDDSDHPKFGFGPHKPFEFCSGKVCQLTHSLHSPVVYKYGSESKITKGLYRVNGASVRTQTFTDNIFGTELTMHDQLEIEHVGTCPFGEPGDSGGLVVTHEQSDTELLAVGIFEGKMRGENVYTVTPMYSVLDELKRLYDKQCRLKKFPLYSLSSNVMIDSLTATVSGLSKNVKKLEEHQNEIKDELRRQNDKTDQILQILIASQNKS